MTCSVFPAPGSRAAAFLSYLRLQHFRSLSRDGCKFLSPQLCKISKMSSRSAKSAFEFLRLTRSWLRIVAASDVNFWESVAAGAKFSFSSESFAPILSRSVCSVSSCDRSSTNSCLSEAFSVRELPNSVCNPIFRVA